MQKNLPQQILYPAAENQAMPTIVFTFLLLFFCKTFLTSGAFHNALISQCVMVFNGVLLLYIGYALAIAKWREKVVLAVVVLLFMLNLASGHGDYLFGVLYSIALLILFRRIGFTRGGRLFVVAYFLAVMLVAVPFFVYTESFVYLDERYGNRLTLGFDNPNTLAYYVFSLFAMLLCLLDRTTFGVGVKNTLALAYAILLLPVLIFSYSRTYLVLALLLLALFWLAPLLRATPGRKLCTLLLCMILGMQFISVVRWGANPLVDELLNQLLTGRIWFAWQLYQVQGLPNLLFGQNIEAYKPIDFFTSLYFTQLGFWFHYCCCSVIANYCAIWRFLADLCVGWWLYFY
ncbi:hypothetical protein ACQ86O_16490 [Serratia sp. L9]|uniref:hypothetical protein n=1 Tax=Serratia sp. L9 TaxID=3423946 RepID=UPI003D669926